MGSPLRPPVPYFGGKITIAAQIAALLPPHRHYVEPFFGSGAVLFAKPPSDHETVNDIDRHLVTFWRVLRERTDELARACALTPHSRGEFLAAHDLEVGRGDDIEVARRVFVRLTQGRGNQLRRTGWRHFVSPGGSKASMPDYLSGYVARMAPAAERLQHVSLECMPALDMIAKYGAEPDALLYVDPPYLGTTRGQTGRYAHEMLGEAEHRGLAESLHAARAAVVLSGYPSDLYDRDLYPGWDRHSIATSTGQGGAWDARTEVLWSNQPLATPATLFDLGEADLG